jgi:hypothetical protein
MRSPALRGTVALLVAAALIVSACGSSPSSATPGVTPRPSPTPDPHLSDPASVDDVLRQLNVAGIRVQASNASRGTDGEPVKRVNATYEGWPLALVQFSTSSALRDVGKFDPTVGPRVGDSPYVVAGMNILIEYGPALHSVDETHDTRFREAAVALVEALDPLLGPLEQRAIDPLPLRGAKPAASAPASPAP